MLNLALEFLLSNDQNGKKANRRIPNDQNIGQYNTDTDITVFIKTTASCQIKTKLCEFPNECIVGFGSIFFKTNSIISRLVEIVEVCSK